MLVVDDEPAIRLLCRVNLELGGYDVREAGTLADARRRWAETTNGQPVFGPKSPIATAEACEAVGGRFRPRLFGWMVHVMAFSDGDPWNAHHH